MGFEHELIEVLFRSYQDGYGGMYYEMVSIGCRNG